MSIRLARVEDTNDIKELIKQLGFDHSENFIRAKLIKLLNNVNDIIVIYEIEGKAVGLISLHFSVQLAFEGDIMNIGYLVVNEKYRNLKIGKELEEYATKIAKEKKCSMIEVYSQAKRTDAHRFYERQGYAVAEKFFIKDLEQK